MTKRLTFHTKHKTRLNQNQVPARENLTRYSFISPVENENCSVLYLDDTTQTKSARVGSYYLILAVTTIDEETIFIL